MIKNIMVWNCWGAGNKNFINQVRTIMEGWYPKILVLLETRVASYTCEEIFKALGYDSYALGKGNGFSSGIWIEWKKERISIPF